MPEDRGASFHADPLFDFLGDELGDAAFAQDDVAEGIHGDVLRVRTGNLNTLRGDNQAPLLAALAPAAQVGAHLLQVERHLGQEDPIRARADAAVERHPARVAAHHLQNQDAPVALGRVPQAVGRIESHADRRIEAERVVCIIEIVIHRLGDADRRQSQLEQLGSDPQRILAAHGHDGVEPQRLRVLQARLELALISRLERIGPGRAQDRAPLVDDILHLLEAERRDDPLHQPFPTQLDAD